VLAQFNADTNAAVRNMQQRLRWKPSISGSLTASSAVQVVGRSSSVACDQRCPDASETQCQRHLEVACLHTQHTHIVHHCYGTTVSSVLYKNKLTRDEYINVHYLTKYGCQQSQLLAGFSQWMITAETMLVRGSRVDCAVTDNTLTIRGTLLL